LKLNNNSSQK